MAKYPKVIGPMAAYAIAVQEGYTGSKQEWAEEIGNAQANAAIAQEAADRAQSLTESLPEDFDDVVENFAPLYSTLTLPVPAGTYCTHDGLLYRANTDIASGETWTQGHWTKVDVGGEIRDLKNTSVFSLVNMLYTKRDVRCYINASGDKVEAGGWHTRFYKTSDIVNFEKVSVSGNSGRCAIGFYNSEKISSETFISTASKFFNASSTAARVEFTDVAVPPEAVMVAIVNHNNTSNQITIDALLKNPVEEVLNLRDMTYRKPRMKFGAHQGFRGIAPQNTIPAYELAGKYGWDYAWIAQIKNSADGTWYVMHDSDVRTTTDAATVLPGLESYDFKDLTDEQITQIHVNTGVNVGIYDPSELYVPKLDEVIEICNYYGMGICFRLGSLTSERTDVTAEQIAAYQSFIDIVRRYGREGDIFSGSIGQIQNLRQYSGENWEGCLFLGETYSAQQVIDALNNNGIIENRSCLIPIGTISGKEDVFLLHRNNVKYYAYKNTSPTQVELIDAAKWGVDIFQNGYKYKIK